MESEVTVIIPSYNPGDYLTEALKSVFNQTYSDWKLILINDASTDNSLLKADKYLNDPRVRVVVNKSNLGTAQSLNIGLALVDTPYIIQLDSDDLFFPDTIKTLLAKARELPDTVGVIYGNFLEVYEDSLGKRVKTILKKGRPFKDRYDFLLSNKTVRPRFYRTAALKEIGGCPVKDPFEGRYLDDKQLLLRLIEKFQFHWIDQVLYYYRRHSSNKTLEVKKYNIVIKWMVKDALKRWGDNLIPQYKKSKRGYYLIIKLAPRNHEHKRKIRK